VCKIVQLDDDLFHGLGVTGKVKAGALMIIVNCDGRHSESWCWIILSYAYIAAGVVMLQDELGLGVLILMISHTIEGSMLHVPNEESCRYDVSALYQSKIMHGVTLAASG
jgi:hypothetical protein